MLLKNIIFVFRVNNLIHKMIKDFILIKILRKIKLSILVYDKD